MNETTMTTTSKKINGQKSAADAAREEILKLEEELILAFPERDAVIRGMLVAAIAGEHVCLIGPPGTAKSALTRAFTQALGSTYYEWLMTRYTTPEEVFGPVSLAGLQADAMRRVTRGKLPECQVAFLDECFKANSAILNALLSAINEKVFHDDGQAKQIPLRMVVGASNELPTEAELEAFYDRFLFRFVVSPVTGPQTFASMIRGTLPRVSARVAPGGLDAAQRESESVDVPDEVCNALYDLRYKVQQEGVAVSDRRWAKIVRAVKACAWLDGAQEVAEEQLDIVQHMLWQVPAQHAALAKLVGKLASPALTDATEFHDAAMALANNLDPTKPLKDKGTTVVSELKKCSNRLRAIADTVKSKTTAARIEKLKASIDAKHGQLREKLMKELGV